MFCSILGTHALSINFNGTVALFPAEAESVGTKRSARQTKFIEFLLKPTTKNWQLRPIFVSKFIVRGHGSCSGLLYK